MSVSWLLGKADGANSREVDMRNVSTEQERRNFLLRFFSKYNGAAIPET